MNDTERFDAIRDELTHSLAEIIRLQLEAMGNDVKRLSWFSSTAEAYAATDCH